MRVMKAERALLAGGRIVGGEQGTSGNEEHQAHALL
jgi:hypothetical protein